MFFRTATSHLLNLKHIYRIELITAVGWNQTKKHNSGHHIAGLSEHGALHKRKRQLCPTITCSPWMICFFCTSHCWGKTIASHGLTSFDDSTQEVSKTFENTFIFWNSLSARQLILERTPPRKGDIIRPCCLLSLCSFLLKLISSLWSSHGRFCQCLYLEDIGIKVNSSGAAAVFFHNQHWTSKLVRTIFLTIVQPYQNIILSGLIPVKFAQDGPSMPRQINIPSGHHKSSAMQIQWRGLIKHTHIECGPRWPPKFYKSTLLNHT